MIKQLALGDTPFSRIRRLKCLLNTGEIQLAGNAKLKIYGTLSCGSGKRMKAQNRVFFISETEAIEKGYRACGHCMCKAYKKWLDFGA